MRWFFVLLVCLALCGVASGAPGPVVPLSASSANSFSVSVSGGGGAGTAVSISGPLPLALPFNLSGAVCMASGTATLAVVNGGLEVGIAGGALTANPTACWLRVTAEYEELTLTVPDIGDAATPVFFSRG